MTLDFNPNDSKKPSTPMFATYVPGRSTKPEFSAHKQEHHAKAALGASVGILYERVGDEWVEKFRRDEDDLTAGRMVCDGCKAPHKYGPYPVRRPGEGYRSRPEVPGGTYLHGSWVGGKGVYEYKYFCGYRKKCAEATLPRCRGCKSIIRGKPYEFRPAGVGLLLYCDADCMDGHK